MGKAVGEVVGHCSAQGGFCHNEGENRRRASRNEGLGRGALDDRSQGKGLDNGVPTHSGEEGYGCNPEEHTVGAVDKGTLKNKLLLFIKSHLYEEQNNAVK